MPNVQFSLQRQNTNIQILIQTQWIDFWGHPLMICSPDIISTKFDTGTEVKIYSKDLFIKYKSSENLYPWAIKIKEQFIQIMKPS